MTWYIPLGLGNWFLKRKIMNFVELDWWQKAHFKDNLLITCVPAMVTKKKVFYKTRFSPILHSIGVVQGDPLKRIKHFGVVLLSNQRDTTYFFGKQIGFYA